MRCLFLSLFTLSFLFSGLCHAQELDWERYACPAQGENAPPYFHLMELPDWDFPTSGWSPDGKHIVFQRVAGKTQGLFVIEVDSGTTYCLSDGSRNEGMPNWHPAENKIAFSAPKGERYAIFEKNLSSGESKEILALDGNLFYPTYSPSGKEIAFIKVESENGLDRTLRVVNLETNEEKQLYLAGGWMGSPAWSIDGSKIYIHHHSGSGWNDIYEVNVASGTVVNTTHNTRADAWGASFSPDGKHMLYIHGITQSLYNRFENTEVIRKNLETGVNERLTWAWRPDDGASYSPDGSKILFQSNRTGYRELYVMDADGSSLRQLTHQPETEFTTVFRKSGARAAKSLVKRMNRIEAAMPLFSEAAMESLIDSQLETLDDSDAEWLVEIFIESYPQSATPYKASGFVYMHFGEQALALEEFRTALMLNPYLLDVWRTIGTTNYLRLLESIPDIYAVQASVLNGLGYEWLHLGEGKGAVRLFTRIVEARPDAWNVFDSLAEAYMWLGNYEKALENYQESLKQNPENTNAQLHIKRIQALRQ